MKTERVPIADLKPDPKNARTHGEKNLAAIRASLEKFGQQKPIVVTKTGRVVAGNGTLAAAVELGWDEIEIVRTALRGRQAKAFAVADNRTAELGEWDLPTLAETMKDLQEFDVDLANSVGFDEKELVEFLADPSADGDDEKPDPPIPEVAEPITSAGETWRCGNHRILVGDVFARLADLGDGYIDCVVTSPPYWGLRDYGTATWEGGDPECDHSTSKAKPRDLAGSDGKKGKNCTSWSHRNASATGGDCPRCGARRVDAQLGLEATPAEHVGRMVELFGEVRRVLRDDGTIWVNYGDCYASPLGSSMDLDRCGLKRKDLVGMPWRVAFGLQDDGWYLRSDIIWAKPNPMPESATDRPTKSHEYVFLMSKSPTYFYDHEAVREESKTPPYSVGGYREGNIDNDHRPGRYRNESKDRAGRNIRDVWTIPTQAMPEAHFATFPCRLVEPCLKAGSREGKYILDPFGGSGTTMIVAEQLGRFAVLVELNPKYADIAIRRWENLTGEKAEKEEDGSR